jgi:hypothetical protein
MNNVLRQFLAGVLAGGITSGTAVVTLLQDTLLTAISGGEWVSIGIGGLTTVIVGLVATFTTIEIDAMTAVGFTSFMTFVVQYFVPNH